MPLSHNDYLELILTHNETRFIEVGVRNPDCSQNCRFHVHEILSFWVSTRQRQNDMNGARVTSSLQNPTLVEHEICSRTHVFTFTDCSQRSVTRTCSVQSVRSLSAGP